MRDKAIAGMAVLALLTLVACGGPADEGNDTVARSDAPAPLVPADREGLVALGLAHDSAEDLYAALGDNAGGGEPLDLDAMPDWSGLWTREGNPFFDPEQDFSQLTTANLKPEAKAELEERRAKSAEGIEYDPISDCSPPGFPRWLAIPFLREFIVTPGEVLLTSETVNNIRRIYTDGRDHVPPDDRYPLWYGDSIGFWTGGDTLVIHTNQLRENVFHRNDPRHSDQVETVEVWRKTADDTMTVDVWAYDPVTLEEPWYTRQTYRRLSNEDKSIRIRYWNCSENQNNTIIQTDEGTSQFGEFTFGN